MSITIWIWRLYLNLSLCFPLYFDEGMRFFAFRVEWNDWKALVVSIACYSIEVWVANKALVDAWKNEDGYWENEA